MGYTILLSCIYILQIIISFIKIREDVKIGKNRKKDAIHFMGEISLFMVVAHDDN